MEKKNDSLQKTNGSSLQNLDKMLSTNYSVAQMAKMARMGELKSIRMLEKENGLITVQAGIEALVSDLALSFNVGKGMTAIQAQQAANLIILEKKHLSIQDLQVCFRRAKTGVYGKIFDRMDVGVMFDFINQYEAEKTGEAEHQSIYDHSQFKKKTDTEIKTGIHPDSQKIIDEIKSRLDAQIKQEREEQFKKATYSTSVTSNVNDPGPKWIAHFDKLKNESRFRKYQVKAKPDDKFPIYVNRYGLTLSLDEWLLIKEKQYTRVREYLKKRSSRK